MSPAYVYYGDDGFSITEALGELKLESLIPEDLWDVNFTIFSAAATSYEEVVAASSTVPFMAPARMVIVEGILATFNGNGGRRPTRSQDADPKELGAWSQIAEKVPRLPPTTILVFRDAALKEGNPLLQLLKRVATVRLFAILKEEKLRSWVKERMSRKGGNLSDKGQRLLTELVGGNLWALNGELEKLQLYAGDRPISEDDVRLLVPRAREANIFTAVDAMMEGRQLVALRELRRLVADGAAVPYILTMIVRQVRLLLLTLSVKGQGLTEQELSRRLGVTSPFVLKKAQEQSQRYTTRKLAALYRQLLDADTAIKTGAGAPEGVLELLVTEVSRARR